VAHIDGQLALTLYREKVSVAWQIRTCQNEDTHQKHLHHRAIFVSATTAAIIVGSGNGLMGSPGLLPQQAPQLLALSVHWCSRPLGWRGSWGLWGVHPPIPPSTLWDKIFTHDVSILGIGWLDIFFSSQDFLFLQAERYNR